MAATPRAALPPPPAEAGALGWLRRNLFASWSSALLTLAAAGLLALVVPPAAMWALVDADWTGASREACSREGACWVFIGVWIEQLLYGRYPEAEHWRVNLTALLLAGPLLLLFIPSFRWKPAVGIYLLAGFPPLAFLLLTGSLTGLPDVGTPLWGGLFLTVLIALVGNVLSLPLGILLALGRRSETMPLVRALSAAFIELWRGVPLITVLFMASVMFPLFLPEGLNFDKLLRALIAITLFEAAYLAEVVRGGLQAIPRGQEEGAKALGLGYARTMALVVLPQALRLVIPGIVNSFIALFKDTTLVLIIGLFDFLGMIQFVGANPEWLGFAVEGYVFAALVFWVFCFGMSRYSQALEARLARGAGG